MEVDRHACTGGPKKVQYPYCSSAISELLRSFGHCFTAPGYVHFVRLMLGWIVVRGSHTISRVLQGARCLGATVHHASVYRFLSAGRWSLDALGRVVVGMLRPWLSETILAIVDDTLCSKSGRQLFGVGIHHDSARSTYSRTSRRIEVLTPGHNWVVVALHVPYPWNPERGLAVPVLFRLYRTPGRCPVREHRKRSELALELITLLASWLGDDERLYVTGDAAYCCKTVLRGLPKGVHFVGPVPLDAALYDTVGRPSGRGRPRRKGYRIANPRTRLEQRRGFETQEISMYSRTVSIQVFSCVCLWYPSAGSDPVRIVITRDRKRPKDGRAYVCTDPNLPPKGVLALYARRWQLEVTFREIKQELGFGDPRNGWWRRPHGERDNPCRPPHRPAQHRGKRAVERTAPLAGLVYALTTCWYFQHGTPELDVARARLHSPWYRHKSHVCFNDMLAACRREVTDEHFRRMRLPDHLRQKVQRLWDLAGIAA